MKINVISGRPDIGMWKGRCQGKTLGIALRAISEALLNPGREIYLVDHCVAPRANRNLLDLTRDIVDQLGLVGMKFKYTNLTIRFDLFQENDKYIELNGEVYKKVNDL